MRKILSIILSITMLLSIATAAFADGIDGPVQKAKLTVGINAEFAPFEYYENGELTGFDIDLMNCIGERIGCDIEYVDMPFDALIAAIMIGKVDCAISTLTITEERESVVDFTRPYLAANVAYKDGEEWSEYNEKYAIAFPNLEIASIKSSITPEELLYTQVNIAIEELIDDHTVEKLIEKYCLNRPFDEEAEINYTYAIPANTIGADAADTMDEENWTETVAVPAPSEWAAKDIDFAYAIGIADINKQYIYKNNITREEFCELIYNLVTLVKGEIPVPVTDSFTDTENDKILMLNGLGIINGKSETEFAPDDYLTREEAATIIIRVVNKVMPIPATEMGFEYDDIEDISEWASGAVQTISNLGFMNGVGNNKFAPKDAYTTEQAIATIVRAYVEAEAAGIVDHSASVGIIGGAGVPPQIMVTDTIEVDDFYIDEAIKLVAESGKLAADKDFIGYYAVDEETLADILELGAADYNRPTAIYYMEADKEQIVANFKALYGDEADGFDIEKLLQLKRVNLSILPNMINASYGAKSLAALTILTNSRGYIMPKDFKKDFALYLEYEEGCSALVSFSEYGDGVISANMSFVINGDKDNIFSRLYEITQALGEGGIDVAKVK